MGRPARRAAHAPEPPAPLTRTARPPSRVRHDEGVEGIRLAGLRKTYAHADRTRRGGPRPRPRGTGGADGRAARAERRRQVDHDRHAARPASARRGNGLDLRCRAVRRDRGGASRRDAADRRPPARPDRPRARRDDGLAVPQAAPGRRRRSSAARIDDIAARRTEKLSGGETQRVRFAIALVSDPDLLVLDEPTVGMDVETRHAFWLTVRAFADARQDGALCDALPRGGGRLCRPRRPGRARRRRRRRRAHEIKSMVGRRRDPRDARRGAGGRAGGDRRRRARRAARRVGRARVLRLRRGPPGAPRARIRRRATSRSTGAGLEEAFLQLTGDDGRRRERALATLRYELLRTFRNRRFFLFSLGFPLVLYYLIAAPEPARARLRRLRHLGARSTSWSASRASAR